LVRLRMREMKLQNSQNHVKTRIPGIILNLLTYLPLQDSRDSDYSDCFLCLLYELEALEVSGGRFFDKVEYLGRSSSSKYASDSTSAYFKASF
jgi:hypothetical protein